MLKDSLIIARNAVIRVAYKGVLKPLFFLADPEAVHDRMTFVGSMLGKTAATRGLTRVMFGYDSPMLAQTVAGIRFENPIGLAAGFDKDAHLTQILPEVGFGFEEIGSVTGNPCAGNPKPRLWRLKRSGSLVVYYGLKNDGCKAIVKRLQSVGNGRDRSASERVDLPAGKAQARPYTVSRIPIGISIAKTNSADTVEEQAGIADYVKAYKTFVDANTGDYFTVNISCPNAFGGEPFTTPEKFDRLMTALRQVPNQKPVFIKMPAEMPEQVLDGMIEVARKHKITGFISTNLAKDRSNPNIKESDLPQSGSMSGKVVQALSDRQIAYLYQKTRGEFVIIGCGGVFTAEDAYRKIKLGASLIQLITGMIFEGPEAISDINRGLVRLLEQDGYKNISEAVGRGTQ